MFTSKYLIGIGMPLAGAYLGFESYKKRGNRESQIILNDKGIQTFSIEFHNWSEMDNDEVIREGYSKYMKFYLVYNHPNGKKK